MTNETDTAGVSDAGNASLEKIHFGLKSLETLNSIEENHFWTAVRRFLFGRLVRRHVGKADFSLLDVGCGNGGLLRYLEQNFPHARLTGVDVYPDALAHCRTRITRATLLQRDLTTLASEPITGTFDVMVFADVLEHLDEPGEVIRLLEKNLAPDGVVIATVPGHLFLWTDRDVFLGHRTRYTKQSFSDLFRKAGFDVLDTNHFFSHLVLPAFAHRKWLANLRGKSGEQMEQSEMRPSALDPVMRVFGKAEAWLSTHLPIPFGTSVYCVARRRTR